jgi:ribosomal protein S18 acetylase RimI-like enzyme
MFTIREVIHSDIDALQQLYNNHLSKPSQAEPADREVLLATLQSIIEDGSYHILVGEDDGSVVASVTLVVVKNLTHNGRPYSIIENVVAHSDYRGRGYASQLMARASEIAAEAGCYKIMLMTGSKKESTLGFYERCGFNRQDKTGFIKWL